MSIVSRKIIYEIKNKLEKLESCEIGTNNRNINKKKKKKLETKEVEIFLLCNVEHCRFYSFKVGIELFRFLVQAHLKYKYNNYRMKFFFFNDEYTPVYPIQYYNNIINKRKYIELSFFKIILILTCCGAHLLLF